MNLIPFIFTLVLGTLPQQSSQNVTFKVFFGSTDIGNIKGNMTVLGDETTYKVISDVEYNSWLYDYQRTTKVEAVFSDDLLKTCKSRVTKYGELEEFNTTTREDSVYKCFSHPNDHSTIEDDIGMTSIVLYFKEPVGISRIFSESYQQFCDISKVEGHEYRLNLPDGKTNHYFYENGQLKEVKVYRSLFTVTIKRDS